MKEKEGLSVAVHFVDEESGCEVLYEQNGVIEPNWSVEENEWNLVYCEHIAHYYDLGDLVYTFFEETNVKFEN